MSKTYKSPGSFAGSWEVRVQSPLDDRQVVDTLTDMMTPATWLSSDGTYYHYKDMFTICKENHKMYIYTGDSGSTTDVANESCWKVIGDATSNLDSYKTDDVTLPDYYKLVVLSLAEYDALTTYDDYTLYYIPNDGHLINGSTGKQGKSAYEIWLEQNSYSSSEHSESEFLASLHAVNNEWVGTQSEFDALETLDSNTTYYITE